jgi:hypothetical protein
MNMKGIINVGAAAIIAAMLATPAAAQEAGTYTGTSADGQGLTFVVGQDSGTGNLAITSAGISFSAPCRNSTVVLNQDWGTGLLQDIIHRKTGKFSLTDAYFTFTLQIDFSADGQSATGTIKTFSPTLDPIGSAPTKALFCESPEQTLSLTLQSTDTTTTNVVKRSSHFVGPSGNTR